jgi:hypothetical protein
MIVPDTKNWTWVLERPCPDCGFDAAAFDVSITAAAIDRNVAEWTLLLTDPRAGDRPDDHTWSALEYACHVRDVFRLYLQRLDRMVHEDGPNFENWDQDATAVAEQYDQQDVRSVAGELAAAAGMLSARYITLPAGAWSRTGFRSDGASFTIDSFTRYLLHDPVHHVWDVRRGYLAMAPG